MNGNVWSSAGDGVHCFAPDGTLSGQDPRARAGGEPDLRRAAAEPAVHHGDDVGLPRLRGGDGRAGALRALRPKFRQDY